MTGRDLADWFIALAPDAFARWCRRQGIAPECRDERIVGRFVAEHFLRAEPDVPVSAACDSGGSAQGER